VIIFYLLINLFSLFSPAVPQVSFGFFILPVLDNFYQQSSVTLSLLLCVAPLSKMSLEVSMAWTMPIFLFRTAS